MVSTVRHTTCTFDLDTVGYCRGGGSTTRSVSVPSHGLASCPVYRFYAGQPTHVQIGTMKTEHFLHALHVQTILLLPPFSVEVWDGHHMILDMILVVLLDCINGIVSC